MRIQRLFMGFCLLLFGYQASAQTAQWQQLQDEKTLVNQEQFIRSDNPTKYDLYQTDYHQLVIELEDAPDEKYITSPEQGIQVNLPSIDGGVSSFYVFYSAISEEEKANGYMHTRSYKGVDVKNPGNIVHLVAGEYFGLSLMGYNLEGDMYFVKALTKDLNTYMTYHYADTNPIKDFECGVTSDALPAGLTTQENFDNTITPMMSDSKFRTYRLALACTPEYADYHIQQAGVETGTDAQKKTAVRNAYNNAVSILNGVLERDMSLKFVLIANTNNLIYLDTGDGGYNDSDTGQMIDQNQDNIDDEIGSANYDLGHVFGFNSGGGLASLSSICADGSKASGASGTTSPEGAGFVIDIVAHEVGHQLGATHTFSDSANGSCSGNMETSAPTQVEVGSGVTIMAYTGLCAPNDYETNPYPFYHYASLKQMINVISSTTCGESVNSGNPAPNVGTILPKKIPHSTPFMLVADATDANNQNTLSYSWEQIDPALAEDGTLAVQPPEASSLIGPNFRLYNFTARNYRSFPSEEIVKDGSTIANGGIVGADWEVLTNVPNRTYTFGVVVRDNNAINGGQTKNSLPAILETQDAGPFLITYPDNIPETGQVEWYANQPETITWNVAGTDANGVDTDYVLISYSTNNGATWTPFEGGVNPNLPGAFPNNGAANITTPQLENTSSSFRIKIEAVGNVYYTMSKRIRMYGINVSADEFELTNFKLYPNPTSDIINVSFTSENTQDVILKLYDFTGREVQSQTIDNNGEINAKFDLNALSTGVYLLKIKDGSHTVTKQIVKK